MQNLFRAYFFVFFRDAFVSDVKDAVLELLRRLADEWWVLWLGLAAFNMLGQRNIALLTLMTLSLFNYPFLPRKRQI